MSIPVNIQFAGIGNPFSSISKMPPYVSKSIKPIFNGEFERNEIQYTFNGQLVGANFEALKSKVDGLFNKFSNAFYPSITIGTEYAECCQLDSISIDGSNYVGIVPYTVQVTCHDKANGLDAKVKNISREISYQETEDGKLQISHRISADGIRTLSINDALSNAKTFVNLLKGDVSDFGPYWGKADGISLGSPILLNQKETINALDANVTIEENYIVDIDSPSTPILRYTIDIASGVEDGNINLSIKGNVFGAKKISTSYTILNLKDKLGDIETDSLPGVNFADFEIINESYDYNEYINTLNFSRGYTNDDRITKGIISNYSIDISSDFIEQTNTITYKAGVKPSTNLTFEDAKTEFNKLKNGKTNVENLLNQATFLDTYVKKDKLHLTVESLTIDENNCIISASQSYNDTEDRELPLLNLDYTIKRTEGLDQISFTPILDSSDYYVENLKYKKRHTFSINGSALIDVSTTAITEIKSDLIVSFANKIRSTYFKDEKDVILTRSNVSVNKENASVSFDIEFSSESQNIATSTKVGFG